MWLLQTSLLMLLLKIYLIHATSQENVEELRVTNAYVNATAPTIGNTEPEKPYKMKGYLIAIIILGIFLGFVVVYKLINHVRNKQILSCCRGNSQGKGVHRSDTFKPLIKEGEQRQSSIYKKGNSAKQPQMV